jgi:hypothetical protein
MFSRFLKRENRSHELDLPGVLPQQGKHSRSQHGANQNIRVENQHR